MAPLEKLAQDARITVRRGGPANAEGRAMVYWMQRAQRAVDNPALETAITCPTQAPRANSTAKRLSRW
jgi:hypothetical protein